MDQLTLIYAIILNNPGTASALVGTIMQISNLKTVAFLINDVDIMKNFAHQYELTGDVVID